MGDRPSWRDIDKMKDGGGGGRRGGFRAKEEARRSRSSKAELDRLFSSGKLGSYIKSKEESLEIESDSDTSLIALAKKATRITDKKKFQREAARILDDHGVPGDFEFLERSLELTSLTHITMVLQKILELLRDDKKPDRSRALKVQIKMLPVKFGEPSLEDLGEEILSIL